MNPHPLIEACMAAFIGEAIKQIFMSYCLPLIGSKSPQRLSLLDRGRLDVF